MAAGHRDKGGPIMATFADIKIVEPAKTLAEQTPDGTPENLARWLEMPVEDMRRAEDQVLAELGAWDVQVRVMPTVRPTHNRTKWVTLDSVNPWGQVGYCYGQIDRLRAHVPKCAMALQVRWAPAH